MAVEVVDSHRRTEPVPVLVVADLFVVSVVGVVLAFFLHGTVQWVASIIAIAAPVEAEHVLWRWRRLVQLNHE